jgi:hypothetical protein
MELWHSKLSDLKRTSVPVEKSRSICHCRLEHPVEVIVLSSEGEDDLVGAASTSTDFWDNPWDDEDWNNA